MHLGQPPRLSQDTVRARVRGAVAGKEILEMKPDRVNILGITYSIEYVIKPSEVDIFKRESMWGQIDYWTRSIRVYDARNGLEDIWGTIIHEVLHGITEMLKLKSLDPDDEDKHDDLDILALALTDVLFRNKWITCTDEDDKNAS